MGDEEDLFGDEVVVEEEDSQPEPVAVQPTEGEHVPVSSGQGGSFRFVNGKRVRG